MKIQFKIVQVFKLVKKKKEFSILEETLENCVARTVERTRLFVTGFIIVCVHIICLLIFTGFVKAFSAHFNPKIKKKPKTLIENLLLAPLTFATVHLLSPPSVLLPFKFCMIRL